MTKAERRPIKPFYIVVWPQDGRTYSFGYGSQRGCIFNGTGRDGTATFATAQRAQAAVDRTLKWAQENGCSGWKADQYLIVPVYLRLRPAPEVKK